MPEFALRIYQKILDFWTNLNKQQKIILVSAAIIFIISSIIILTLAARVAYAPLFTNLAPEDAAQIVNRLKDLRIEHKLAAGGTAVLVPQEVVYETRLTLAAEGLPRGGGVGFEIFDKAPLTQTDFQQRVNYRRALQGELERTIIQLEEVESARVHIVLPEPRLYLEEEDEPTASVLLKLKPFTTLQEEQVRGIVNLVSHSVEGLKSENVIVFDIHGNILTDILIEDAQIGRITKAQREEKRMYEKELQRSLQSMLERVLGPNKAIARVSADLDFSRKEIKSEIFKPVVDESGIPRSEETEEERFEGTGIAPGGIPGVSAHIPGYPVVGPGQAQYERERVTTNYEISRINTIEIPAPGTVKRLSVAVIVDDRGLTPERIEDIRQIATVACGLDIGRGDQISVVSMPFSTEVYDREKRAVEEETRRKFLLFGTAIVLTILLLITVYLSLRPKKALVEEFLPLEAIPIEKLEVMPPIGVAEEIPKKEKIEEIKEELPEDIRARLRIKQIFTEIERLVVEKPETVALTLRSWVSED